VLSYRLGVDLGMTFTAAAVRDDGPPAMVGLGNRALQVPSVLYFPPEGGVIVGEAAERRGLADPTRMVREFKRRIGDSVPLLVAGVPYSPQALTAYLLRWVVETCTQQKGEPPERVILTYPANWGPFKRDLLTQVIQLADVGEVGLCSEPEAAAAQYAARARLRPGERIAVYDLGGGTFDTCVLERSETGFELLGDPVGIEHLGGIDFDDAVFQHVLGSLDDRLRGIDLNDEQAVAGLARLRRECVEAKEALSTDVATIVPVALPGLSTSVRLNRSELEDMVRPPLEETVAAVRRSLRSAGVEPADLRAVVLVGGGSRIPLVSELLQQELGVPIALDTHPKHDIALGAVQTEALAPPPTDALPAVSKDALPAVPTEALPAVSTEVLPAVPMDDTARRPVPAAQPVAVRAAEVTAPLAPTPAAEPDPAPIPAAEPITAPIPVPAPVTAPVPVMAPSKVPPRGVNASVAGPAPWWGRNRVAVVTTAVAVSVVLIGATLALTIHDKKTPPSGTSSSTTSPSASASARPSASSTPSAASVPALPVSAPLTQKQLVVPMNVGGNWDIYLADIDHSAPVARLTKGPEWDSFPVLSADRQTIISVRRAGDLRTLRVMAADGTGERQLFTRIPPECGRTILRPAWNPVDPTQIAAACIDAQNRMCLYLFRTDGKVLRKMPVSEPKVDDPAYSPDGHWLAYQAGLQDGTGGGALFVAPVDGSGPTRRLTDGKSFDADPVWSPDGTLLAFRRRVGASANFFGDLDLFVIRADGSGPSRRILKSAGSEQDPTWSPSGDQIAFKSDRLAAAGKRGKTVRIWVMNADGTGVRRLWTQGEGEEQTAPAWSRR
jgi:molecular chaperone DnaK